MRTYRQTDARIRLLGIDNQNTESLRRPRYLWPPWRPGADPGGSQWQQPPCHRNCDYRRLHSYKGQSLYPQNYPYLTNSPLSPKLPLPHKLHPVAKLPSRPGSCLYRRLGPSTGSTMWPQCPNSSCTRGFTVFVKRTLERMVHKLILALKLPSCSPDFLPGSAPGGVRVKLVILWLNIKFSLHWSRQVCFSVPVTGCSSS